MAKEENALCKACLELLQLVKIPAWRNNSGATKIGGRFIRYGAAGSPDILGILPPEGRWLGIEVKTPTGRQRPSQKQFQEMVEMAGGIYLLVRDIDDLASFLRDMRFLK